MNNSSLFISQMRKQIIILLLALVLAFFTLFIESSSNIRCPIEGCNTEYFRQWGFPLAFMRDNSNDITDNPINQLSVVSLRLEFEDDFLLLPYLGDTIVFFIFLNILMLLRGKLKKI